MSTHNFKTYSIYEHYYELKKRVLYIIILFLVTFAACYHYSEQLLNVLIQPLATGDLYHKIIFTNLPEGFTSYIKIAAYCSFFIIFPFIVLQIFLFIHPGLHKDEKIIAISLLILSIMLFYSGISVVFFQLMPKVVEFFMSFESPNTILPIILEAKLSEYISLTMHFMLVFASLFQLPIIVITVCRLDLVAIDTLTSKRKIVIVVAFILGGILTPPDIFSQIALALPMILLYEISIISCRLMIKKD